MRKTAVILCLSVALLAAPVPAEAKCPKWLRQFSLRSMLIVGVIGTIPLAYFANHLHFEQQVGQYQARLRHADELEKRFHESSFLRNPTMFKQTERADKFDQAGFFWAYYILTSWDATEIGALKTRIEQSEKLKKMTAEWDWQRWADRPGAEEAEMADFFRQYGWRVQKLGEVLEVLFEEEYQQALKESDPDRSIKDVIQEMEWQAVFADSLTEFDPQKPIGDLFDTQDGGKTVTIQRAKLIHYYAEQLDRGKIDFDELRWSLLAYNYSEEFKGMSSEAKASYIENSFKWSLAGFSSKQWTSFAPGWRPGKRVPPGITAPPWSNSLFFYNKELPHSLNADQFMEEVLKRGEEFRKANNDVYLP